MPRRVLVVPEGFRVNPAKEDVPATISQLVQLADPRGKSVEAWVDLRRPDGSVRTWPSYHKAATWLITHRHLIKNPVALAS